MAASNSRTRTQSRNSRSRGNNLNNSVLNSIHKELHGHKFVPSEMPPTFIAQPWNNMTLILREKRAAPLLIKVSDLRIALQAQCGFSNVPFAADTNKVTNVHFDIRIKGVSVWAIDSKPFSLLPMDLLNSKAELCRIDSNPQKNMYARAGYKFPLAQSSVTISTFTQPTVVILNLQNANEYEIHLNVLWKGADTSLPTLAYVYPPHTRRSNFRNKLEEMLRTLDLSGCDEDDDDDVDAVSSMSSIQHLDSVNN